MNFCIKNKKTLLDLTTKEYKKFSNVFDDDLFDIFNLKKSIEDQIIYGSTSTDSVKNQLEIIKKILNEI